MGRSILKRSARISIVLALFFFILVLESSTQTGGKLSVQLQDKIRIKGGHEQFTAWVYFNDKGTRLQEKMTSVLTKLNSRSLQRRRRHLESERLVDVYDVPVHEPYVEKCKKFFRRIRHRSRWLNAVSVEATGFNLKKVAEFFFVKKIDIVRATFFREPIIEPKALPEEKSPVSSDYLLDYGPSLIQVEQLNVPVLHDLGYSGRNVLICMLDSGFNNLSHQALDHIDIVATWDFINDDPSVFDEPGQMGSGNHGTRTLGAIAGYHPGELVSPAFGASFLLGKTENTEWERHVEEDHWIAGAEWADRMGADIISSSLGYRGQFTHGETSYTWEDMDGMTTVVTQGANIAVGRGILVVNSAGNEEAAIPPRNTLIGPADSPLVLAAGAVNAAGDRVGFSSMGPTSDGRIKPDVMALGFQVYSTGPSTGDEYNSVNGTSFSCPLVAGVAALILEINPTWTNLDIMEALKQTARDASDPDNSHGWGVVDAHKAAFFTPKHIHPPENFALKRVENDYIFFIQYIDRLSWKINGWNSSEVSFYRLYSKRLGPPQTEFEFLAELSSQVIDYERRGLLEGETFLYKITAVDDVGQESDPDYARW